MGVNSFVNLGRNYEGKCRRVLSKLFNVPVGMVGGANDGGIDLIWSKNCPDKEQESAALEFIGQCKLKLCNRVAPEVCRALDGVLSKRSPRTIGCLISNLRPSVKALQSMNNSSFPQMFFKISECAECDYVKEISVNQKFKELYPNIDILHARHPEYLHYILKFS